MSTFGKFILGTIVGGVVGAAIGVLIAPRSGQETRDIICDEFNSQRDELKHRYDDSLDAVKAKADAIRNKADRLSQELEELGRRTMDRVKQKGQHPEAVASDV